MVPSQYVVWFMLFGLFGWVFESTYCSIVERRWCNRGFLFGPICPIYGVGAVAAIAVFSHVARMGAMPEPWQVFLVCAVGASAIEWVTSCAMERMFGTVWWDYSDLPLNIRGRVCVPAATLFGLCGLGIVYVALPLVTRVVAVVPPVAFELVSLVLVALLATDVTLAVSALTELVSTIEALEASLNERVQETIDERSGKIRAGAQRVRFSSAEARERLRDVAANLDGMQRHVLLNARRFRTLRLGRVARGLNATLLMAARTHAEQARAVARRDRSERRHG